VLVLGERGFEDLEQCGRSPIALLHPRPGDVIYVYYGARRAFAYYAPRGIDLGESFWAAATGRSPPLPARRMLARCLARGSSTLTS
jgi:hypothetical protein